MTKPEFSFVLPNGINVSFGKKDYDKIKPLIEKKFKEVVKAGEEVNAMNMYALVTGPVISKYFE